MLLNIREFRETKGRAVRIGVPAQLRLYRATTLRFESKERRGKLCVLRHGVHH
jgi:hypothetical protein